MCGPGLNPFIIRCGQNLQDLLKDNNNSGIAVSFIYLFFWFKWGGGRGIWQVKIYLGVYNVNVTGPGWACLGLLSVNSIRSSRKEISS